MHYCLWGPQETFKTGISCEENRNLLNLLFIYSSIRGNNSSHMVAKWNYVYDIILADFYFAELSYFDELNDYAKGKVR